MNYARTLGMSAMLLVGSVALAGCAAGIPTSDTESIAIVEEFFEHLETGEATAAAALTDMEFLSEMVSDNFYAASIALPENAVITKTEGYDGGPFTATVEYILDDPSVPVALEVTVRERDGELKISGWGTTHPSRSAPTRRRVS